MLGAIFGAVSAIRTIVLLGSLTIAAGAAIGIVIKKDVEKYFYKREVKNTDEEFKCLKKAKNQLEARQCRTLKKKQK